jgi:ABC-type sugar transport system substrate-binding protein
VISLSDNTAEAIINAARKAGRTEHVVSVAMGAGTRLIRAELRKPSSIIVAATLFRPERYGGPLLDLAQKILRGEKVPPAVYFRHAVVDRGNINDYYPEN